ncbi:hypothetical protein EON63_16730 [archaeon]|nr:MAG: hypothetical protein EON63_16730 [archaeon]
MIYFIHHEHASHIFTLHHTSCTIHHTPYPLNFLSFLIPIPAEAMGFRLQLLNLGPCLPLLPPPYPVSGMLCVHMYKCTYITQNHSRTYVVPPPSLPFLYLDPLPFLPLLFIACK